MDPFDNRARHAPRARHSHRTPARSLTGRRERVPSALLRAGLAVTTVGAALGGACAQAAVAAEPVAAAEPAVPAVHAPHLAHLPSAARVPGGTSTPAGTPRAGAGAGAGARGTQGDRDARGARDAGAGSVARTASDALGIGVSSLFEPVKDYRPDPLAGSPVDPLDNVVGTQLADFKPITSAPVTAPLTQGDTVRQLPLVGQVVGMLPG